VRRGTLRPTSLFFSSPFWGAWRGLRQRACRRTGVVLFDGAGRVCAERSSSPLFFFLFFSLEVVGGLIKGTVGFLFFFPCAQRASNHPCTVRKKTHPPPFFLSFFPFVSGIEPRLNRPPSVSSLFPFSLFPSQREREAVGDGKIGTPFPRRRYLLHASPREARRDLAFSFSSPPLFLFPDAGPSRGSGNFSHRVKLRRPSPPSLPPPSGRATRQDT